jgi:cell division protease FtsH
LEESVEVVIAGYERKNAVISMKDKLTIAYHEIGHALVAAKQTHSAPVHKITIVPRTSGALGLYYAGGGNRAGTSDQKNRPLVK